MDLNVQFSGNLSAEQRAAIVDFEDHVMRGPAHFGKATTSRLELREVDVLLDAGVLGAQLLQAARRVHALVERGRQEALRRPDGR